MRDAEIESSDSSPTSEEKSAHFAQAGPLRDPALGQLRDQIKKVMIPLLIKTFQYKLELNQSMSAPSRLQSQKNQRSPDEIIEHLKTLDADLKVLLLWCQSCHSQIQKALSPPEEEQINPLNAVPSSENAEISKHFSDAVSAPFSFFKRKTEKNLSTNGESSSKSWWQRLLGK